MASENSLLQFEVAVVGAGPSGATAAMNLAPTRRVALIDANSEPHARIGESLPAAARRLLSDIGLWERFRSSEHRPCFSNRAVWGSAEPFEMDSLRDPDGHGWHLDRVAFESLLRNVAVERGCTLLVPARLVSVEREGERWRCGLQTPNGPLTLTAAFVIDAGGRTAPVASRLGAVRQIEDRLVCAYLYGVDSSPERAAGFTYVEAEENGWWYTAPLPGGRRVLAFHTDADMPAAGVRASGKELLNRAASRPGLARLLGECGFGSAGNVAFTAANSGRLKPFASAGWCAAGDAAMCFDPLSSQGLFNALYSGLAAAEAAEDFLSSGQESRQYSQALQRIYEVYRQNLACFYAAERRWSRVPFWQRRHALASHVVRD